MHAVLYVFERTESRSILSFLETCTDTLSLTQLNFLHQFAGRMLVLAANVHALGYSESPRIYFIHPRPFLYSFVLFSRSLVVFHWSGDQPGMSFDNSLATVLDCLISVS